MANERFLAPRLFRTGAVAAAEMAVGLTPTLTVAAGNPAGPDTSKILNYNPDMEYRRCGKTGLMVSAVALGGHWKRVDQSSAARTTAGWIGATSTARVPEEPLRRRHPLHRARHQLRRRLQRPEILAYSRALQAAATRCTSASPGTTARSASPSAALREAPGERRHGPQGGRLDYFDLWRISLLDRQRPHTPAEIEESVAALEWAKKPAWPASSASPPTTART